MKTMIVALALSIAMLGGANAQSAAKGLDETACKAGNHIWRTATVAGETVAKSGQKHKRTMKAHCRSRPGAAKAVTASK